MIVGLVICFAILMNLVLGFAATGHNPPKDGTISQAGCCGHSNAAMTASNFLARFMFLLNYLLYHCLLLFALIITGVLIISYLLSSLCVDGKTINISNCGQPFLHPNLNSLSDVEGAGTSSGQIDLRQFSPLFDLGRNETDFLFFSGVRLKKLCSDYMKELYLNIIICFVGCILLVWAFVNFLINLSVNYAKISTKRKYAELMYLNSSEMVAFADRWHYTHIHTQYASTTINNQSSANIDTPNKIMIWITSLSD